MEANKI